MLGLARALGEQGAVTGAEINFLMKDNAYRFPRSFLCAVHDLQHAALLIGKENSIQVIF